jgi:hypothetical protein
MKLQETDLNIVAVVPAFNRGESIGATLRALRESGEVDAIVVIDDGSDDNTADQAKSGADIVVRFERNLGKGAALERGIEEFPDADVYLFVDADLGGTAGVVPSLLTPILADDADLVIGVPIERAGRRGGLGMVRSVASKGIGRACGFQTTAPLSGQRAIRGSLARSLKLASRFGVETAMTIDAVRSGSRVVEAPIQFDHRHTGRSLSGFVHRAWQGVDIVRALAPRVLSSHFRTLLKILCALAILLISVLVPRPGSTSDSGLVRAQRKIDRVLVFGIPRLQLNDLNAESLPNLYKLLDESAVGATSVRTLSGRPTSTEGYATVGAGARVRVAEGFGAAYESTEPIGSLTAGELTSSRTGSLQSGAIVLPGIAATQRINEGRYVPSLPGALADAVRNAGKRVGVVSNSDTGIVTDAPGAARSRPATAMATDSLGGIAVGVIGNRVLQVDPSAPQGVRVNEKAFTEAVLATLERAELVVADPGELDRVGAVRTDTTEAQFQTLRAKALQRTDRILGMVLNRIAPSTMVIVTSVRPATSEWELTPTVVLNAPVGYLQSPSTQRLGLITLTDIAPTILDQLGIAQPKGMIGDALAVSTTKGRPSLDRLQDLNSLAAYRERIYLPLTKGYVIFQTFIYLGTIVLFASRGGVGRSANWLERIVLGIAAWPLATFVFRMIPSAWHFGPFGGLVVLLIDFAIVWLARRRSIHRLSSLSRILFATVTVIVIDVCLGARLQQASILGYSPHTAARFTGIGNAAFASLAVCTVLWVGIHVQFAERKRNALLSATVVCALVFVVDGAPWLGSDVGGILTLAPVFGLLLYVLSGRRLSVKALLAAASATISVLTIAVLVDLTRPSESRSHLGRFVLDIGKDNSTFSTTIGRKIATNIRVFTGSFWTWIVPVIAITLLFFLGAQRGWQRDLPVGSALRAGLVASLLAGLLGFAVNDSGTVVTALVFVEIGPMVTLLALHRNDGRVIVGDRE